MFTLYKLSITMQTLSNGTSDDMKSKRSESLKSDGTLGKLRYIIRRLQISTANAHCNNNHHRQDKHGNAM